jgi:hypothetical protein
MNNLKWFKSTRSAVSSNCVEVALGESGVVHLRDSKNPAGGILSFEPRAFAAFIADAKSGELDRCS